MTRAKRKRMCGSKRRHTRRKHAVAHMRELHEPHLNVYKCRYCGKWHVGHHPGRPRL